MRLFCINAIAAADVMFFLAKCSATRWNLCFLMGANAIFLEGNLSALGQIRKQIGLARNEFLEETSD